MRGSVSKKGGFTNSCSKEDWKNVMVRQFLKLGKLISKRSPDPNETQYHWHNLPSEEVKAIVDLKENGRQLV
jgi:hypothetical protein